MNKKISSTGLVLSRKYFSEADAMVDVYTKDHGKLRFVAKGIKKLNSRKRGSLEPFSLIKFSSSRGSLPILTEVEIVESFPILRKSLKKTAVAYYFVELVTKTSYEEEKNVDLFNLLKNYLERLEGEKKLKVLRLNFARDLLVLLGFWPEDRKLTDPDENIEVVIERSLYSMRVGKALVV